jgi:hypothetical protein
MPIKHFDRFAKCSKNFSRLSCSATISPGLRLYPMQLKHPLCDIHSNYDSLHVGPSGACED